VTPPSGQNGQDSIPIGGPAKNGNNHGRQRRTTSLSEAFSAG
jgi:hypothetical protein